MKILISIIIVLALAIGYIKMSDNEANLTEQNTLDIEIAENKTVETEKITNNPSANKIIENTQEQEIKNSNIKTYTDTDGRFSFQYPSDKEVVEQGSNQISVTGFTSDGLFNPQLQIALNLGNQNIDGLYKQYEAEQHLSSIEWIRPIDGRKAFKFVTNEMGRPTIFVIDGLYQYSFIYTKYWEESGMLDTFKIN